MVTSTITRPYVLCIRNGNQLVKILLAEEIPCFVRVEDCDCRDWYPCQPFQCSICRGSSHRAPACPLSGLCRSCRQPGHMTRECTLFLFLVSSSDGSSDESDYCRTIASRPVSCSLCSCFCTVCSWSCLPLLLMILTMLRKSSRIPAPRPLQFLPLSLFLLNLLPCLPLPLQLPFLLLLLPFLFLLPCLPPLLLLPGLLNIVSAPAPATVTASFTIVTASVPTTVTVPIPTTSSSTVPASKVSVAPSTAFSDREFL